MVLLLQSRRLQHLYRNQVLLGVYSVSVVDDPLPTHHTIDALNFAIGCTLLGITIIIIKAQSFHKLQFHKNNTNCIKFITTLAK